MKIMNPSIVISNLPLSCNSYEISTYFGEIGQIKRSFLIKNEHKEFTGTAQVTYQDAAHAAEAVEKLNNAVFKDQPITVDLSEQQRHIKEKHPDIKEKHPDIKAKSKKRARTDSEDLKNDSLETKSKKSKTVREETIPLPIQEETYHQDQPGRLIVRNVSFQATKQDVHKLFAKYGSITDINFPRNNRVKNNMKGCVFVQFSDVDDAVKAIKECNLRKFLGRHIAVDHAMPKGKYQVAIRPKVEVKREDDPDTDDVSPLFTVPDDGSKLTLNTDEQKLDTSVDCTDADDIKEESSDSDEEFHSPKMKKECSSEDIDTSKLLTNVELKQEKYVRFEPKNYPHKTVSRDVEEGRTMFISKLAIDTTAFSVETVLSKFGELKYTMLVMDKFTEQSKGTAFAQFKSREAADACLSATEDPSQEHLLTVDGKVMEVRRACGRNPNAIPDIPKGKDNRNLYLAKEGFIREGTRAAADVSAFDLQLRRQREKVKQKLLSNLHMFVSPTRLCVNNLPPSLKDPQLRQLFKKHAPPKARVTESRVMRYLDEVDASGVARSRCYGFITFSRAEDALAALRTMNNSPKIFTPQRRPIIEFSIENRSVLNKKVKRLQNSKQYNKNNKNNKTTDGKGASAAVKPAGVVSAAAEDQSTRPMFAGFTAKKGDLKPGKKIHRHLDSKVRHRDRNASKGKGTKSKGASSGKGASKSKGGFKRTKGKGAAMKKKVKKYTKI